MQQQHIMQIYIDIPRFTIAYVTMRLFQMYIHIQMYIHHFICVQSISTILLHVSRWAPSGST